MTPSLLFFGLAAQAAAPDSTLRGTRVKIRPHPDSVANHVHNILAEGRIPPHNIVNVDGGVIDWGFTGTAHEALVDLLAPGDMVPSYFSGDLRAEPSAFSCYATSGPLLIAVGEAQFGDDATLIALADPSYRFVSVELTEVSFDGAAIEPERDMSEMSDFFGVSAQQWDLSLEAGSGTLSAVLDIEWVTRHDTVSVPLALDASGSAGDATVRVSELNTEGGDEPGLEATFSFAPVRALGFYVSGRDLEQRSMGYSDDTTYVSYDGAAAPDAAVTFSFPRKQHHETVRLSCDLTIPAEE